jgi:phenylacetate-coenzyme A ligase PaaK-like adenylate-forming protein
MDTAQGQTLQNLKLAKLPTFAGRSNEDIDTWLFLVHQYALTHGLEDGEKIPFAASYLTDQAATWWRYTVHANTGTNTTWTWTWTNFYHGIRAQFRPISAEKTARDRLVRIQQTTSVVTYIQQYQQIMIELPPTCTKLTDWADSSVASRARSTKRLCSNNRKPWWELCN